jgi:ferredoxin
MNFKRYINNNWIEIFMPDYARLTPTDVYREQTKKRSWARIRTAMMGTVAWGLLEVFLLRVLGVFARFFPSINRWFMRLLHGRFGGVVTPFEAAIENDPKKRNWQTRDDWQRVNKSNVMDPVGRYLKKGDVTILPTQEVMNLMLRTNLRPTVSYCFCRLFAKEHGHKCELNAPLQTCMTLSFPQSVDQINSTEPKENLVKNKKAVYELLKRCDEIGLVHQVVFIPSPNYTYVLCNCCPDCCEVLANFRLAKKEREFHRKRLEKVTHLLSETEDPEKRKELIKQQKDHIKGSQLRLSPLEVRSVFISETIDPQECINCGKCADRCYFDARFMAHGEMHYDPALCYGCGLCVTTCPQHIIRLLKRRKSVLMAQKGSGIAHVHPHKGHPPSDYPDAYFQHADQIHH